MGDRELSGMEEQPAAVELFAEETVVASFAVIDISHKRMKNMLEMAADLVAAAGERFGVYKGIAPGGVAANRTGEFDCGQQPVGGEPLLRLFRLLPVMCHPGLRAQEKQARRLLNDLDYYRARTDQQGADESIVAHQWLTRRFEPIVSSVPKELRAKLESAELYHEVLEHRWFVSEKAGSEISIEEALRRVEEPLKDLGETLETH